MKRKKRKKNWSSKCVTLFFLSILMSVLSRNIQHKYNHLQSKIAAIT